MEKTTIYSATPTSTGFYSQKLWRLIFLALETWAGGPDVGLDPLIPENPSYVCPPQVGVGLAHSASPTLLPVLL